jgi:hypothetical protein
MMQYQEWLRQVNTHLHEGIGKQLDSNSSDTRIKAMYRHGVIPVRAAWRIIKAQTSA